VTVTVLDRRRAGDPFVVVLVVIVPAPFAAATAAREGPAGQRWITQLPTLVDCLLEDWDIGLDGPVRHGYVALVIPVRRRDRSPAVLKVSWVDEETRQEGPALTWWAGHGAVALLDADPTRGALLLERLHPDRSLEQIPEGDALKVAGSVLRRLHTAAAPTAGFSSTADLARRWSTDLPQRWRQLGRPGHRDVVAAAVDTCRDLPANPGRPHLVHGDFHYANVLTGPRGWLAIDPKPMVGDPEFDLLPLLRNRWADITSTGDPRRAVRRRLAALVAAAGQDGERARRWAGLRALNDALWGLEHRDPVFTATAWTITQALA